MSNILEEEGTAGLSQVKPLLVTLAFHSQRPVQVPAAPLRIPLSANVPEEVAEDGPSVGVPASLVGDVDGVPGSWLQLGSDQAVVPMWVVNQWVVGLSLPFSVALLFIYINK